MQDLRQRRPAHTRLAQPSYGYRSTLGRTHSFLATWN